MARPSHTQVVAVRIACTLYARQVAWHSLFVGFYSAAQESATTIQRICRCRIRMREERSKPGAKQVDVIGSGRVHFTESAESGFSREASDEGFSRGTSDGDAETPSQERMKALTRWRLGGLTRSFTRWKLWINVLHLSLIHI